MKRLFLKTLMVFLVLMPAAIAQSAAQSSGVVLLAGYKVNPPVPTAAAGSVTITLKNDSLSVEGSFTDLSSSIRGASIHYGSKRENGNQLFQLNPALNEDLTGGTFEVSKNTFKLTDSLKEALKKGLLYINIYTQKHPRGELRGQIPAMPG